MANRAIRVDLDRLALIIVRTVQRPSGHVFVLVGVMTEVRRLFLFILAIPSSRRPAKLERQYRQ